MKRNKDKIRPPMFDRRMHVRQKVVRFFFHLFGWIGLAVLFYVAFSFFFDTPVESRMKHSTVEMRQQYEVLNARYDSLDAVLRNVVERDRNVFKVLFEAEPYDLDSDYASSRWTTYEELLAKGTNELAVELDRKTQALEKKMAALRVAYDKLAEKASASGEVLDNIPAIQPVINKELTLLTASYGLRIHPFYKTLVAHNGVDYTVPEGSRVFATADGRVKDVIRNNSSSGLTVIVSHGANYETQYSHLSRANVRRGESVKRGDIIALTGNTGLSLAPHLHYEVRHNDMRVDPIHYFFMELTPFDYRRIQQIARSGMQSFD
ncbi:M23 family metallopeptidase [Alistipes sp. OttesenSCG-928-B03]|nr:M23 family metallopeptidase [Alistipes sp. OttesenSCG-928-B03]